MAIHINNISNFTSNLTNTHIPNPSSKSSPSSFLSFGSNFNNPMMNLASVSCKQNDHKRSLAVAASVATTQKTSTAPEEIVLKPIKEISGTVNLPGSKSLSNRILLLAALAEGTTVVDNLLNSDDVHYMLGALRALGLNVEENGEIKRATVEGCGGVFPVGKEAKDEIQLFLGNAGTAMRPLTAAVTAAGGNSSYILDGVPRMRERPIGDLVTGLKQLGADVDCFLGTNCPPVRVAANGGLPGGKVKLSGSISSQYLTALLMAAPLALGDVEIEIIDKLISVPYVEMTLKLMERFGVSVEHSDSWDKFYVRGGQKYKSPGNAYVEGDASSASYFLAGAAITGGTVTVEGCGTSSLQGDVKFAEVLGQMGAEVTWTENSVTVREGNTNMSPTFSLITTTLLLLLFTTLTTAQTPPRTPPSPPPASDSCNGIFISYTYTSGSKLPPDNPSNQPYRFESELRILNNAAEELKSWRVFVGFQHDEYLVSASNAVIADGSVSLPGRVGNGTVFAGFPSSDLKTAIETAGDINQMSVRVELVGTQFGVGSPDVPMPRNISLANDGFVCPRATMNGTRVMNVCCTRDPNAVTNETVTDEFLPRQTGDLTIMYDVTRTYESDYWAEVTIENHSPLGRLDNWNLTWDWMRDEFINDIKGAHPYTRDSTECIFGPQGAFYKELDFSNVLNCERRPTIIDLPLEMTNNTKWGMIPFCCRNGTILPPTMDPSKSKSAFQVQVFKMPPDLNRSELVPPQNFKISGRLNPDYKCGPPVRVSPSEFPDPSGLPGATAVASWQVVCNITQAKGSSPRCCVSFSAYYNQSIIPCPTCACGCPSGAGSRTCSTTAPALFLPPQALLVPFDNRTELSTAWASIQRRSVPNPLPCGDNCGVSLNWHLLTDYRGGWTARVTLFNWDETSFADWFVAMEMGKSAPGFEKAYSFNASSLEVNGANDTIFMQGLPGLNYLVGEVDGNNPKKDPRVPGKQQSVISFTKKLTPGINVAGGDGFPTKVFFNGEECALPRVLPTSGSFRPVSRGVFSGVVAFIIVVMLI